MTDNEHFDLDLGDLGEGPAHRPVDDRLAAGRRALRRRRAGTAFASVAVVAVMGTTFALVAGPGSPDGGRDASFAGGDPAAPAEPAPDDACFIDGGVPGSDGTGEVVPPLPAEPPTPAGEHGGGTDPALPGDPNAPDGPVTSDAPDTDPPPDLVDEATAVPAPEGGMVVCCVTSVSPAYPAEEPPAPPVGTVEPGTVEPGTVVPDGPVSKGAESGVTSRSDEGTGTGTGTDSDSEGAGEVETDPAPGTPPVETLPAPNPVPMDCGAPDEVPGGGGTAWGGSDGTMGGTRTGPIDGDLANAGEVVGQPADITSDGELVLADGVEVTDRIDNPLGVDDPDHSLAVEVTDAEGDVTWVLLGFTKLDGPCGQWSFTSQPATKKGDLADWVDSAPIDGGDDATDSPSCVSRDGTTSGSSSGYGGGVANGSVGKP